MNGRQRGNRTRSTVSPSPPVDVDAAAVPLDDDPPGDVEAEAGALADLLGRVERVERTGRDLRCHPGPVSPTSTDDPSSSARGGDRSVPSPSIGVDGVVERLVHTWLSSPGYPSIRGRSGVVLAHDRHAVAQLVAEHHQRALDPLGHVDRLHARPGPSGCRSGPRATSSEIRPVASRTSASSRWSPTACRPPSRGRPAASRASRSAAHPLAPGDVGARAAPASRRAPSRRSTPWRVEPARRAPPRGRPAPAGSGRRVAAPSSPRAARRARRNCSAVMSPCGEPAERPPASGAGARRGQSTAGWRRRPGC